MARRSMLCSNTVRYEYCQCELRQRLFIPCWSPVCCCTYSLSVLCPVSLSLLSDGCWHVMLACDAADTKKILIGALLSEYHDTTRTWCLRFLEHLAQLSSDAHQWVLQLLLDNMQEADCKPSYCLAYYSVFAVMISSLPQQNPLVRPCGHCSAV